MRKFAICFFANLFVLVSFSQSASIFDEYFSPPTIASIDKEVVKPGCFAPRNLKSFDLNDREVLVTWHGLSPKSREVKYEIQYKTSGLSFFSSKIEETQTYVIIPKERPKSLIIRIRTLCINEEGKIINESEWIYAELGGNRDNVYNLECSWFNGGQYNSNEASGDWAMVEFNVQDSILGDNFGLLVHLITCSPVDTFSQITTDGSLEFKNDTLFGVPAYNLCGVLAQLVKLDSLGNIIDSCDIIEIYNSELVEIACGAQVTVDTPSNNNLISNLAVDDIFFSSGMPVTILTITSQTTSGITGTGELLLPFQSKNVNVEFTDLKINTDYLVFSGTLEAEGNSPSYFPSLYLSGITGGEICVPPTEFEGWADDGTHTSTGEPYDPYGFDQNGHYIQDTCDIFNDSLPYPQLYNPNGFDKDGIHISTNTIYNTCGCSREGFDESGQSCDPTCGLQPCMWVDAQDGNYGDGTIFGDENKIRIDTIIDSLLRVYKGIYQSNLDSIIPECNAKRTAMRAIVSSEGLDSAYIFGDNSQYINKGLAEEFESAPQKMISQFDRDEDIVDLENYHVDLFECDEKESLFEGLIDIIVDVLSSNPANGDLLDLILNELKTTDNAKIDEFKADESVLIDWISNLLKIELTQIYETQSSVGILDTSEDDSFESFFTQVASIEGLYESDYSRNEKIFTLLDLGFEKIDGFHPALYYREMIRHKRKMLSGGNDQLLPMEITKSVAGLNYTIIISKITVTATSASCDAFLVIEDPNSGQDIIFEGHNIGFHANGVNEGSTLSLASDVGIRLSNNAKLWLYGTGDNSVTWDCNGFKEIEVDGAIEFCRNYLVPLNPVTFEIDPDEEKHVFAYFQATAQSWGDFSTQVTIDPFAVANHEQVRWEVQQARIDMSEFESPSIKFPAIYNSALVDPEGYPIPLWKGFALDIINIKFINNDSSTIGATVNNLIIDDLGFTGEVGVNGDIMPISTGSFGGWAASIDSLMIQIIANQLTGGGLGGFIHVPILADKDSSPNDPIDEDDCLRYSAHYLNANTLAFKVTTQQEYRANLWVADLALKPNSEVSVIFQDSNFYSSALLHGGININGNLTDNLPVQAGGIGFQNVLLSNTIPYFTPGTWSFPDELGFELAKMQLIFNKIRIQDYEEDKIKLDFQTSFLLTDNESFGIDAQGSFGLIANIVEENGRQKWKYDRMKIDGVYIDAEFKKNYVKGGLIFYENLPTWGNGFRGLVGASFSAMKAEIQIGAAAQFGRTLEEEGDFRYFFVDAIGTFEPGIELGGLKINGFGGGINYHMEKIGSVPVDFTNPPSAGLTDYGLTYTGFQLEPNEQKLFGLSATVVFSTSVDKVFSGNATFFAEFNSSDNGNGGGLSKMGLKGNGSFFKGLNLGGSPNPNILPNDAVLTASVEIEYDFENEVLKGVLESYLNVGTIITGQGENGLMGTTDLYFDKDKWYIWAGTPVKPYGIEYHIPVLGSISSNAYFAAGNFLPERAVLPDELGSLKGLYNGAINSYGTGMGVMFGGNLKLDVELDLSVVQGSINGGLGFDINLQNYQNLTCSNSNGNIGLDGWYGQGYAYAYGTGSLKIGSWDLGEASFAALMQAQLPNPTWIKGDVEFKRNNKTKTKSIEFGEACNIVGGGSSNPSQSFTVITGLNPSDSLTIVSPDIKPEAYFSIPVNQKFTVEGLNGSSTEYEIKVVESYIHNVTYGYDLSVANVYNPANTKMTFTPDYLLPPNADYDLFIKVEVYKDNVLDTTEIRTAFFQTAEQAAFITDNEVINSWPIDGMSHFHKGDITKGFLQFKYSRPELFYNDENDILVTINNEAGIETNLDWNYDPFNSKLEFDIGQANLGTSGKYTLTLTAIEKDDQATLISTSLPGLNGSPSISTISNAKVQRTVLFEMEFETSAYNTLKEKIGAITGGFQYIGGNVKVLQLALPTNFEGFDGTDFKLLKETRLSNLENLTYFNQYVEPIYDEYISGECTNGFLIDIEGFKKVEIPKNIGSNGGGYIKLKIGKKYQELLDGVNEPVQGTGNSNDPPYGGDGFTSQCDFSAYTYQAPSTSGYQINYVYKIPGSTYQVNFIKSY